MSDPTVTAPDEAPSWADDLPAALEAVLMVVDEPVPAADLAEGLGAPVEEVRATLERLAEEYTEAGRGFDLRQVAGAWRMYSRPAYSEAVERFLVGGRQARLTQAALETLAVIAYRQPISRGRVAAVRGVNVDGVVRTLVARGLIAEVGAEPSGAVLYGTTHQFLERMGLADLAELPDLAPFLPDAGDVDAIAEGLGAPRRPGARETEAAPEGGAAPEGDVAPDPGAVPEPDPHDTAPEDGPTQQQESEQS
ncbi:SMC-Scp complex subunit ScpB [Kytococcus sp. HMSC28H12]|uniref:SMC-Scp complex subunit ScpB n=1 Tax=Kytococcus sp. HMSC28H12 TaxID=1581067 RepID=UPI0009F1A459